MYIISSGRWCFNRKLFSIQVSKSSHIHILYNKHHGASLLHFTKVCFDLLGQRLGGCATDGTNEMMLLFLETSNTLKPVIR